MTIKKLKNNDVEILLKHKVVEVDEDKVTILGDSGKITYSGIDRIVEATGMSSYLPIKNIENIPVYYIGDAKKIGKALYAIHDAFELAFSL